MQIRQKTSYSDIRGSIYLFDDWKQGKTIFSDGSEPQTKDIKYDVIENVLIVRGEDDVENTFTSPIKQFSILVDGKWLEFKNGFKSKDLKEDIFVQVLYSSNKTSFYKKETKTVIESKGYNTASVEKKIESSVHYYLQLNPSNNELIVAKRDTKSLLTILDKSQLEHFIKENKLNLKKDDDLIKLLTYYDSL